MPRLLEVMRILQILVLFAISLKVLASERGFCDEPMEYSTSIVQLLANPEKYDGHRVQIVGFGVFEYEGDAVYLHRQDWSMGLTQNAVAIDIRYTDSHEPMNPQLDLDKLNMKYIRIDGRFKALNSGEAYISGISSGVVTDLCSIELWVFRRE